MLVVISATPALEERGRAEAAGFETLNLSDIYVGQELGDLKVAEWDWHPNARGHALIAESVRLTAQSKATSVRAGQALGIPWPLP